MKIIHYIILGIVQGITEPLPISSSGHLRIIQHIFNTSFNDLNFEIVVNFGSLMAILFIFRKELIRLIKNFFIYIFNKSKRTKEIVNDFKYCLLIIIGSVPVGIAGILLKDFIEEKLSNINLIGFAFIITAIALFIVRNNKGKKQDNDLTYKDAIIIGLFQMIALFPGISRSGMTLVGCLLVGLSRNSSLKYTFMLYIPVSFATFALGVLDLTKVSNINTLLLPYSIGLVLSLIATLISYKWLSEWVKKGKLWYFSIYCLMLALILLFLF